MKINASNGDSVVVDNNQVTAGDKTNVPAADKPEISPLNIFSLPVALVMGFLFGLAFEKSRVFEPYVIRGQFVFKRWIMMKMFLAAVGTSCLSFIICRRFFPHQFSVARKRMTGCCENEKILVPLLRGAIGATLLGVGMCLAGACPGMVLAQLGAGVRGSYSTLVGCLVGALLFGLVEPSSKRLLAVGKHMKPYVDLILGIDYSKCAFGLSVCMACIVCVLEVLVPWQGDLTVPNKPGCTAISCMAWPPSSAGCLIGLLQIPAMVLLWEFLGGSRGYCTVVSQWTVLMPRPRPTHIATAAQKGEEGSHRDA